VKACLILGAIVSAWISGAGIPDQPQQRHLRGAVFFLWMAVVLGVFAWSIQ